jgi:hypothetical protein
LLAVADSFAWQPRSGWCERFLQVDGRYTLRGDGLGYFYAPAILLDQRYAHPTIRFIANDGFIEPLPAPPLSQYHPLRTGRWHDRFPCERPVAE